MGRDDEEGYIEEEDHQPGMAEGIVGCMLPGGWGKDYKCSECGEDLDGNEDKCPGCGCTFRN